MKTLLVARIVLSLTGVAACASLPFLAPGAMSDLSSSTLGTLERAFDHAREALSLEWVSHLQDAGRPASDRIH